jgi:hypothetical protein
MFMAPTCTYHETLSRGFPDGLWPTTTVGLSGDPNADPEIGKHLICSMEGVSVGCQDMILTETPCVGASIGDLREPSPLPPVPLEKSVPVDHK